MKTISAKLILKNNLPSSAFCQFGLQRFVSNTAGSDSWQRLLQYWGFFASNIAFVVAMSYMRPFSKRFFNVCYIAVTSLIFSIGVCYLAINYLADDLSEASKEDGFGISLMCLFSLTLCISFLPVALDLWDSLLVCLQKKKSIDKIRNLASVVSARLSSKSIFNRIKPSKTKLVQERSVKPKESNPYATGVKNQARSSLNLISAQSSRKSHDVSPIVLPSKKLQKELSLLETPLSKKSSKNSDPKTSEVNTPTTLKSSMSSNKYIDKVLGKEMGSRSKLRFNKKKTSKYQPSLDKPWKNRE